MTTSMQDTKTEYVSEIADLGTRIEPRQLDVTQRGMTVAWQDNDDLNMVLKKGEEATGVTVPTHAEGGLLVIGLHIDGEESLNEVISATPNDPRASSAEVISHAIEVLTVLRDGVQKAEGRPGPLAEVYGLGYDLARMRGADAPLPRVTRNILALIAARSPLDVNDIERVADVFDVPVADLFAEDFDL